MHTEVTEKQMPWSPLGQENSPEDDAAYFQQLCTKLFHFLQQRNSTSESHAKALLVCLHLIFHCVVIL